eukprot:181173_1
MSPYIYLEPIIIIHICILQILSQIECNYIRVNDDYIPPDVCLAQTTFGGSYYFTCIGNGVNSVSYRPSYSCQGSILLNTSTDSAGEFQCTYSDSCEYVKLRSYTPQIGNIQCSDLDTYNYGEHAFVINKCVLEPSSGRYKLTTCTHDLVSVLKYSDTSCNPSSIVFQTYESSDCEDNQPDHVSVTECTHPLNTILDECGYIQLSQDGALFATNTCMELDNGQSAILTCYNK